MKAGVQARLRDASHACHVLINRHPLLVGLTGRSYGLSTYHTVLVAYSRLYSALESSISQFIATETIPFDYATRAKLNWLQDDLRYLKNALNVPTDLPQLTVEFPEISSVGQLIGVLYPIEGSTLGGQVISRHLQQNLGLGRDRGASFFHGYGEETFSRWTEFCAFADSISEDAEEYDAAERSTLLTFYKFEEILDEYHRTAH